MGLWSLLSPISSGPAEPNNLRWKENQRPKAKDQRPKVKDQRPKAKDRNLLKPIAIILGIVIAAVGGVIAYRAFFLEPSSAVVISNAGVREVPDTFRVVGGLALLLVGAVVAFTAAMRKNRQR